MNAIITETKRPAWNKGKLIGQKRPLKLEEVWTIRVRLELSGNIRDLALFNLAIDCKLGACDLVKLKLGDTGSPTQLRCHQNHKTAVSRKVYC